MGKILFNHRSDSSVSRSQKRYIRLSLPSVTRRKKPWPNISEGQLRKNWLRNKSNPILNYITIRRKRK